MAQQEEFLVRRPERERPVGVPTATLSDFLDVFLDSMVVAPHGRRVSSYTGYLNPIECVLEMHHGDTGKLCALFLKMWLRARQI